MRPLTLFMTVFVVAFGIWAFTVPGQRAEAVQNQNACVKKVKSEWGERCRDCSTYKDSYRVVLQNTCDEPIDLQCCVQKQYKNWRCFKYRDMKPNDTLVAYACSGTGKYLKWARKAGDKSVVFPNEDEVNRKHK